MKKVKRASVEPEPTQDESGTGRIIPLRSETALSRFPIHRLSKKGNIKIRQTKKNEHGKTFISWEIRNVPGPLAYKLDTAVINRRIDEHRNKGEIPQLIKLGSLGSICEELGFALSGRTTNQIKEALRENAGALITARLNYKGNDGTQRDFEFTATRYGIILTGEKLPSGEKADAVYIELHPRYHEMLNHSQTRPLDYQYLLSLPPAAQRLYELLSFGIFGALKHGRAVATMLYSELCSTAPLTRYYEWEEQARKQLYKLHKPHLDSGYIAAIEYEDTIDAEGRSDWIIRYTPGPKARREFKEFTKSRAVRKEETRLVPRLVSTSTLALPFQPGSQVGATSQFPPDDVGVEDPLVSRLIEEEVTPSTAPELVRDHREECERQLAALPLRRIDRNKGGFLADAIRKGYRVPTEPEPGSPAAVAVRQKETEKSAKARAEQTVREEHREKFADAYHAYLRPERARIERERAKEYKNFADFIAAQRALKNLSPARRESIELGFFEEFVEERPELGVMTFWQWDVKRMQA